MLSRVPRFLQFIKNPVKCLSQVRDFTNQDVSAVGLQDKEIVASTEQGLIINDLDNYPDIQYQNARQVWIESLDNLHEEKNGIISLHPEVFACSPRVDIIHRNVRWQQLYKKVSFEHAKSRAEMSGGGRKPWPQKGLGRARHGSIRSPLFKGGGSAHGPRAPKTYFHMIPFFERVIGLTSTLSVKLAQDDLHIVKSLEIPTDDPKYLEDLVEERKWGLSVLFIDNNDIMPPNITAATDKIGHINIMPTYGLNVYSMLKHETLVLTVDAVKLLHEKLLYHLHRSDVFKLQKKYNPNQQHS